MLVKTKTVVNIKEWVIDQFFNSRQYGPCKITHHTSNGQTEVQKTFQQIGFPFVIESQTGINPVIWSVRDLNNQYASPMFVLDTYEYYQQLNYYLRACKS